jgi:WD40 repeat protein
VAWSADGRRVLTGGDDGTLRLWDAGTGRELVRCLGHQGRVWGVVISADGRRALSGGADKTVRLWDLASGQELCRCTGHTGLVRGVALAPDGQRALSCASGEMALRLWDLRGAPAPGWRGLLGVLFAGPAPLSAAGVAALAPGRTVVIDKPVRLLEGHTAGVQCVAFTPDGRRALSGGHDRTVRVWDPATGQEERRFEGHTNVVECLTLSADGRRVLSGSWDGLAVCWEVDTGRELSFCAAHVKTVTTLAFAPGGRFLTTSWLDPVVRLWQMAEPGSPAPPSLEVPPTPPPGR